MIDAVDGPYSFHTVWGAVELLVNSVRILIYVLGLSPASASS